MRNRYGVLILALLIFTFWMVSEKNEEQKPIETAKPAQPESKLEVTVEKALIAPSVPQREAQPVEGKLSSEKVEELRSLARSQLSSSYSSQKAYFAENKRYSTDLRSAGWTPSQPLMKYKMGFLRPFTPDEYIDYPPIREEPRRMDTDGYLNVFDHVSNQHYSYDETAASIRLDDYQQYCRSGCTADDQHFEIVMAIPLGDKNHVDVWTINDKKELVMVVDGQKGEALVRQAN